MKKILLLIGCIVLCLSTFSQPNSFSPRGVGGGGALFFPKINPGNDNEFYISCDMSELFHSTDFTAQILGIIILKFSILNCKYLILRLMNILIIQI